MKQLMIGTAMVLTTAAGAWTTVHAQANAHAAIEKQIVASENAVMDAFVKNDPKMFQTYVVADSFGIDAGGIGKASDMVKSFSDLKVTTSNIDLSQFYWINESTMVHMYRWTGKGTYKGQPLPSPVWASSVWDNRAGKWVAVFHQESMAAPAPPTSAGVKK